MYVRLAFAVAAHLEPEILIVDEVLAVGDAEFQKKCLGKMREVATASGRTVLFVSHNMGAVTTLCDRAMLLDRGRLVADGPPPSVVDRYLIPATESMHRLVSIFAAPRRGPRATSSRSSSPPGCSTNRCGPRRPLCLRR